LAILSDEIIARPGARRDPRALGLDATPSGMQTESLVLAEMRKVYRGRDIEVSFDLDICVHVGECLRGDRQVFRLERRPWVMPDEAEAEVVAQVVERCPSGALQYRRLDGAAQESHAGGVKMVPIRDGPLLVTGSVTVTREDGTVETLPRATLCRCGQSEQKPFCDNTHLKVAFRAPGVPYKIHLSEVRHRLDRPITKAEDPRRLD
jgi:uncharacterized Fe-S cluster protein YjdI/CDGSH-type Zn-finger protein